MAPRPIDYTGKRYGRLTAIRPYDVKSGKTRWLCQCDCGSTTVCERWHKFEHFLADMGERPEGRTLDRIDGDQNYEPGNCRWATQATQSANRNFKSRRSA